MDFQEILFNSFAHSRISIDVCVDWFKKLEVPEQRIAFDKLSYLFIQSHPSQELVRQAVENAPIKKVMTPSVIFLKNNLSEAIIKIQRLPDRELVKAFTLLLFLFGQADEYRREVFCKGNCRHEWHNFDYQNWQLDYGKGE